MKVLCLFDTGVDRGECNLLIGLKKAGVDLWVLCKPGSSRVAVLREAGITVEEYAINSKVEFGLIVHLRKLLKQQDFDLVHAFRKSALSNYNIAAIGMKRPPVVAYRGIIGNLSYWDPFSWLTFLDPRIKKVICVCDAIKDYFLNKKLALFFSLFSDKNVVRIYKGHKVEWYTSNAGEAAVLPSLGVPSHAKVIGCISRVKARKGIKELIQSIDLIKCDSEVHLVILGSIKDQSFQAALRKSRSRDRIHVLGFNPDAAKMAAEFDIITLPSLRREGLPRAVIEGMSHAIAPVVTDAGGSAELIVDNVSGLVVKPGSPEALAEAFTKLLSDDDLRKRMGKEAQKRIIDGFGVDQTVIQTLGVYSSVL